MYEDLIKLGFMPNKELRLKLPEMPKKYLRHFIRGYFDGDGCVVYGYFKRSDRNNKDYPYIQVCFAYANAKFLEKISKILSKNLGINAGYLNKKEDHLYYSKLDSIKLFYYMYRGVSKEQYLERKYNKFKEALKIVGAVA